MNTQSNTPAVSTFRITSPADLETLAVTNYVREQISSLIKKAERRNPRSKISLDNLEMAVRSAGLEFMASRGKAAAAKIQIDRDNPFAGIMMLLGEDEGMAIYEFTICTGTHVHVEWDIVVSQNRLIAKPVLAGKFVKGGTELISLDALSSYLGLTPVYDSDVTLEELPFHPSTKWAAAWEVDDLMAEITPAFAAQAGVLVLQPDDAAKVLAVMGINVDEVEELPIASELLAQYVKLDN